MSQTDILQLLVKVLIIAVFFRLCVAFVPLWVLAAIGLILLYQSGILDPKVVSAAYQPSVPIAEALLPFLVLLTAFAFLLGGLKRKR